MSDIQRGGRHSFRRRVRERGLRFECIHGIGAALLVVMLQGAALRGAAAMDTARAPATQPVAAADAADGGVTVFGSRLGGGSRGAVDAVVFLMFPQTPAVTANPRPTIYWYLDRAIDADEELVVSRLERRPAAPTAAAAAAGAPAAGATDISAATPLNGISAEPVLRRRWRGMHGPGLKQFTVPLDAASLAAGTYKVTVLLRHRGEGESDSFSSGFLRIDFASPPANNWLDQLDQLCRSIADHPDDAELHHQRYALLQQQHVFLSFSAPPALDKLDAINRKAVEQSASAARASEMHILESLDPPARASAPADRSR